MQPDESRNGLHCRTSIWSIPLKLIFATWSSLLQRVGTAGNLTTNPHLATLALERGLVLHTTDADFARFPGLKWINPLA